MFDTHAPHTHTHTHTHLELNHDEVSSEREVRLDMEGGAGEDQTLVFAAHGAIPENVDTSADFDAEERARAGLAEEFVAAENGGGGGGAAKRPPDDFVVDTVLGGEIELDPSEYGIVHGLEPVEAGEKQLEIGEKGLEALALPEPEAAIDLLVKPRVLRVDTGGTNKGPAYYGEGSPGFYSITLTKCT